MTEPFDFKKLLNVPAADAAPLILEQTEAEWARYGRNVHALMNTEKFTQAIQLSSLRAKDQSDLARRVRIFLTTGVIPT